MRAIVAQREEQVAALAELRSLERISLAAAISRAIDEMLNKRRRARQDTTLKQAFRAYDDAVRTIIDFPEDQRRRLDEYCAREHTSRADAVRRAVQTFPRNDEQDRVEFERALDAAFGMWKDRRIDTGTYLAELRAEWDREWVDGESV